ncbi:MAG: Gp15 family bacteriophage protein [Finegoldia magna]|nr:Gp15 family bacteriophage protein [Anaerococcus sp.]MDU2132924.1 Gp15 family bacteriophage protein [Finegoldia magna]
MTTNTNYLTNGLPRGVQLYDYFLEFNTDFKQWIKYEELMLEDDDNDQGEDSRQILMINIFNLCFKDGLNVLDYVDADIAINQILWFFTLGGHEKDEVPETDEEEDQVVKRKSKIIYSFIHDWGFIYSAFMQCYGIDLFDTDLHWWKFKSLFDCLSDDTQFSKILGYRSVVINSKMSKEEKNFYRNMKRIYSLPDTRTEEEKETSFARSMYASMKD